CYLEGRTHAEVAEQLGRPLGTVRSWVARGRELLRRRLARRGLSLSAEARGAVPVASAAAVPRAPSGLVGAPLRAAPAGGAGLGAPGSGAALGGAGGLIPPRVVGLREGGLSAAWLARVLLAACALAVGGGAFLVCTAGARPPAARLAARARGWPAPPRQAAE